MIPLNEIQSYCLKHNHTLHSADGVRCSDISFRCLPACVPFCKDVTFLVCLLIFYLFLKVSYYFKNFHQVLARSLMA